MTRLVSRVKDSAVDRPSAVSWQQGPGKPRAGGDQLAHRPAGVGVQAVPDQDHRTAELLVRSVQEPGIVRLGEPLALVPRRPRCVQKISRVRLPGRPATCAAWRLSWPPWAPGRHRPPSAAGSSGRHRQSAEAAAPGNAGTVVFPRRPPSARTRDPACRSAARTN